MGDYLIEGGTVVDGKLTPACAAHVRVTGGVVTELGSNLALHGDHAVVRAVKG